jgi:tetratricopeptide (TPR) repeat protein
MRGLRSCLLLLSVVIAVWPQTEDNRKPSVSERFRSELDVRILQRQYDKAEEIVNRTVAAGADPAATFFEAGKIYFDRGEWQRSAVLFERSLKLQNKNDEAHQLLGLAWRALRRPDDAEAELLVAVKQNPSKKESAYLAGHQLLLNGKFEAALPYLYSALESKALQCQALGALGFAQARLGNYGLAETYYRKAIDSPDALADGHYPEVLNLSILLLLGHDAARLEQGLEYAERAKRLRPASGDAHFLAGKALFKLGRLQEAAGELARAARLNPEDNKSHFLLARIYDQLGQPDLARKHRKEIARVQNRPGQSGMATVDPVPVTPE